MILFLAGAGAGVLATLATLVVVDLVQQDRARRLASRAEPSVRRHPANRPNGCRVIPPVFDQDDVDRVPLHRQVPQ